MTEPSTYLGLIWSQTSSLYASASVYLTVKGFLSIFAIVGSVLFGVQNYELLGLLGVLVVIDMVTGIMASFKLGHPISSRRALKTATKSVVYLLFFSAAYITGSIVPPMEALIVNGVLSFLAITEFLSVIENVAKMGYAIPKKLLNQLNDFESSGGKGQ